MLEDLKFSHNMKNIDIVCIYVYVYVYGNIYLCICMCIGKGIVHEDLECSHYGVTSVSRINNIVGLFCKRAL